MTGTAACTGSRGACWRGRRGRPRCRPRRAAVTQRARGVAATTGSSAASTRWPSVWPSGMSRTPAEIRLAVERVQIGAQRRRASAMPCPAQAAATATGKRDGPSRPSLRADQRRRRPCRAGGVEKGAALRGRLQVALLRWRERRRRARQRRAAPRHPSRRPRDAHERRKPHRRIRRLRRASPRASRRSVVGIRDVAGLDRPFDAARIGERADRIGRRQPRHQPIERARSASPAKARHPSRRESALSAGTTGRRLSHDRGTLGP